MITVSTYLIHSINAHFSPKWQDKKRRVLNAYTSLILHYVYLTLTKYDTNDNSNVKIMRNILGL